MDAYRHCRANMTSVGGGASGVGNEPTGRARCVPGIPPVAAVLTVGWEELEFPVPLVDGRRDA